MDLGELKLLPISDESLKKEPSLFDFEKYNPTEVGETLFARMKELGGVGLSANQVGLDMKFFVFGDGDKLTRYIANPILIAVGDEQVSMKEGCLSLPGVFLMVKRPTKCTLKYHNENGDEVVEEFLDLAARVVLHEYDHMLGQNFTQRVSKMKLDRAIKAQKKKVTKNLRTDIRKRLEANNV
jgi:peptide deformylase